jgi:O-antigen/teichoic acid export membrane protein
LRGPELGLTPRQLELASVAFLLSAAQVAAGFATRLPYGILEAHDDFVTRNAVMAGELLARLTLTMTLLPAAPTLATLAWIQLACLAAEFAASWAAVAVRHRAVRFSLAHFDRSAVRAILSFSVYAMLLNVGTLLAFRCAALVIGARLDAGATTQFDIGNKFFEPLMGVVIGVGAVVMPAAARLGPLGDRAPLVPVFLRWSKVCFSLVLAVGVFLLVLGPEFLAVWVGEEFRGPAGRVLRILMVSFLAYLPVRGVALPILMGLGKARAPTLGLLAMGAVNLALSLALVRRFELDGVALATALPNVAFALFVGALACRAIGVRGLEFARYVVLKPLCGALVPAGVLVGWKTLWPVDTWLELGLAGAAMSSVFAATWIVFVLRGDPWIVLPQRLRRGGSA